MSVWVKNQSGRYDCPFNREVSCLDHKCHKCGWHPMIGRYRLLKARYEILLAEYQGVANERV